MHRRAHATTHAHMHIYSTHLGTHTPQVGDVAILMAAGFSKGAAVRAQVRVKGVRVKGEGEVRDEE